CSVILFLSKETLFPSHSSNSLILQASTLVFHARTCNIIAFPLFSSHLCNSPVRFMSLSSSFVV
ncbi:unnamed protein product, partial [Brassica oleracea var. botrytis]